MARALNTDTATAQLSITLYYLGMSLAILVYGTLSERFGRRPMLIFGLVIVVIGSLICAYAPNINTLLVGRLIQGCGTAAGIGLSRSMLR